MIELKNDTGEEELFNLCEIKLLKGLMLLTISLSRIFMGYEGEFSIKYNQEILIQQQLVFDKSRVLDRCVFFVDDRNERTEFSIWKI